jgi:hypothetical protein
MLACAAFSVGREHWRWPQLHGILETRMLNWRGLTCGVQGKIGDADCVASQPASEAQIAPVVEVTE